MLQPASEVRLFYRSFFVQVQMGLHRIIGIGTRIEKIVVPEINQYLQVFFKDLWVIKFFEEDFNVLVL
jgi:hypothetical protein